MIANISRSRNPSPAPVALIVNSWGNMKNSTRISCCGAVKVKRFAVQILLWRRNWDILWQNAEMLHADLTHFDTALFALDSPCLRISHPSVNKQEVKAKMKSFCCHRTSTHLFLRIQHVFLTVIRNAHWTSERNGAFVARESFEKVHVLQKWEHLSSWCQHAGLANAAERWTLTSAWCFRSLKYICPDNWNLVVDSFSRMKVSHVMDAQLLPCVQNWNAERNRVSESWGQGVWLQIPCFTLEPSLASFSHRVLFYWNERRTAIIYWDTWGCRMCKQSGGKPILPVLLWRCSRTFQSCARV